MATTRIEALGMFTAHRVMRITIQIGRDTFVVPTVAQPGHLVSFTAEVLVEQDKKEVPDDAT